MTKSPFSLRKISLKDECISCCMVVPGNAPVGNPACLKIEPIAKVISPLEPSMAPVPLIRSIFPASCGMLNAREKRMRAAPACCVFVAAADTGSNASALFPPPPHPAATAAVAATASAVAMPALRPRSTGPV